MNSPIRQCEIESVTSDTTGQLTSGTDKTAAQTHKYITLVASHMLASLLSLLGEGFAGSLAAAADAFPLTGVAVSVAAAAAATAVAATAAAAGAPTAAAAERLVCSSLRASGLGCVGGACSVDGWTVSSC